MKNSLTFFILSLCLYVTANAQQLLNLKANFYNEDKIIQGDGYAYQCIANKWGTGETYLYNVNNVLTDSLAMYKDGTNLKPFDESDTVIEDEKMYNKLLSAINHEFTIEEAATFGKHPLTVEIYIDSNTGDIKEVKFSFFRTRPYIHVPVSRFRNIEMNLKNNVHFTPTEEGRKRTFIYLGWMNVPTGCPKFIAPDNNTLLEPLD